MNLKYKIALTMLLTLNLKLYPMQEDINNNNNNVSLQDILPNDILKYDVLDKINDFNENEIQNILNQNIELKKKPYNNCKNITENEDKIKELIKKSFKNLININLVNKKFKEFIYYIIKKSFNKLNKEQIFELLSILIKDNNMTILVKIILDQDNIDLNILNTTEDNYQFPIIIYAQMYNNKSIIEFLIANGANINIKDKFFGKTALTSASENGHTEIAKLLIENGADINLQQGNLFETPLILASANGHIEIVKLLIENGADLNKQTRLSYITALISASTNGHIEIAKLLIENGANLNIKDINGNTALMSALKNNDKDNTEIAKLLIDKGADINIQDNHGKTALILASEKGYTEIVRLLEKHANNNNQ